MILPMVFITWKVKATGLEWFSSLGLDTLETSTTRGGLPKHWQHAQAEAQVEHHLTELVCTLPKQTLMASGPVAFLIFVFLNPPPLVLEDLEFSRG